MTSPHPLDGAGLIQPDSSYGDSVPDPREVRGLGPNRTSGGRVVRPVEDGPATPAPAAPASKRSAAK